MRRALAILKYVPAMLCGLLVVGWIASVHQEPGVSGCWRNADQRNSGASITLFRGSIQLAFDNDTAGTPGIRLFIAEYYEIRRAAVYATPWIGEISGDGIFDDNWIICYGYLPISLFLTALIPFAFAPFTRFRFSLWSYLAWTALLAAELAYYLR